MHKILEVITLIIFTAILLGLGAVIIGLLILGIQDIYSLIF